MQKQRAPVFVSNNENYQREEHISKENNKQMIHDPNRIFAGFHLYYAMTDEDRQEAEKLKMEINKYRPKV